MNSLRCYVCMKKIKNIMIIQCDCKQYFCYKHKIPIDHDCTFDYFQKHQNKIKNDNVKIEFKKFEKM